MTSQTTTHRAPAGAAEPPGHRTLWARMDKGDLGRACLVLLATAVVAVLEMAGAPVPLTISLASAVILAGCWPILVEACQDLRHRRMSMELSMLLAIVAAVVLGQWVTALVITVFVLAAEILEDLCMDRGRDALTDLMSFLPSAVRVQGPEGPRTVELDQVRTGQTVIVPPGGRVPVDGTVTAGSSSVDQSRITGESMPRDVTAGDAVFAGSVNHSGALEMRVDRIGAESSYGQIIRAVERAQASRAPVQRLADRFAGWLVYFAPAAALVTLLVTKDLRSALSVVIVAGACGIAAGTPLAVLATIGRAAHAGVLVKDGEHLEKLSEIDTVVFDKTGTLTVGRPQVVSVRPVTGVSQAELLSTAASAEWHSEHPLADAIVARAATTGQAVVEPRRVDYEPGAGVTAVLDGTVVRVGSARMVPDAPDAVDGAATAVHVSRDGSYLGTIGLADEPRAGAAAAVESLHGLGLRTVMLTGDEPGTARMIAERLGIDDVRAGLLPVEKQQMVKAEHDAGHRVVMVGDGVNDAAALAAADVGVAVASGTDIAQHSADMVLVGTDLADLTTTVGLARRARRIVTVNFVGTVVVDLIGMVLAATGMLGPLGAALIHVGSESAFILNSARLIPGGRSAASEEPRRRGSSGSSPAPDAGRPSPVAGRRRPRQR